MLFETYLSDLYRNAVIAFPTTEKRQYATHPVIIKNLQITPFLGVKTLFVKGLAQNEGKEYNPIILFKNIKYNPTQNIVKFYASDGTPHAIEQLSSENNHVVVRCGCPDFRFRMNYYNHLDKSLYGSKVRKYESKGIGPPANPQQLPAMCKHLMKLQEVLQKSLLLS